MLRESRHTGSAALLLALALGLGCGGSPPRDVLLITVDTLRPDHLGLYGYPRRTSPELDRWFADAVVFERAYATEASTPPSVVSLLSGLHPQEHGVRLFYQLLPEATRLLPELLPPAYQSAAFVSNVALTQEALGIAPRFEHYDDFVDDPEPIRPVFERVARKTTDAALLWLFGRRDPERPLFLWVHYIDPHGPYLPPSAFGRRFDHEGERAVETGRINDYQIAEGVTDALDYVDRYDEEIAYTDAEIGRLLAGYARTADLDQALVVFTADHGESMFEHERWFTHSYQVYDEIMRVPLLLRAPGRAGGRRSDLVSGIDVAPTILRFAGAALPEGLPGRDLLREPDEERSVFAEGGVGRLRWRAVWQGDEKWVLAVPVGSVEPEARRHYDLARDPEELRPGDWHASSAASRALLDRVWADPSRGEAIPGSRRGRKITAPKVAPRADAEALERLRTLGYVE